MAEVVLTYLSDRGEVSTKDAFINFVKTNLLSDIIGKILSTFAEHFRDEQMQQGLQEDRQQGMERYAKSHGKNCRTFIKKKRISENEYPDRIAELTSLPLEKIKELKRNLH